MPWLCEARHSRFRGNLETFATGGVGIGRAALGSWSPIGVGDELRGNDGGAVDSRFHGNDRWGGMGEGGDGGILTDAVAPQNPSFPRKRESRDLCDGKAGIGRVALGSWCPMGVGELE